MNLAEFAEKNPAKSNGKCWLCDRPERAEVEQAKLDGIATVTIVKWLKTIYGDAATRNRVESHLRNHV